MAAKENHVDQETIWSIFTLQNLTEQYPITYLSFADLSTYELLILVSYGIMLIFSFFTNLIAIIIFFFGRRSRSELTPFLLNLSVFNIIMTVYCIPFTISSIIFQRWLFASELCVVLDSFKTFSVSGVLLTLITIALDRYCVVKYAVAINIYFPKKRNLIALAIIWILSITLAIIWSPARSIPTVEKRLWVNSRTLLNEYLKEINNVTDLSKLNSYLEQIDYKLIDTLQCLPNKIERSVEVRRTIFNFLQTYFVPLFILAFFYLRIAVMLWQRRNDVNYDLKNTTTKNNLFTNESIQFKKKLKQGIKMLIAVVVLYAILWLPMNVFQLCLNLLCYPGTKYQHFCAHPTLIKRLYIVAHFLTVSNTAINPIIYGFTNNRFRSDIRQLRRRLIHCQTRTPLYYQAKFVRKSPQELEDRHQIVNGKAMASINQRSKRKLIMKRTSSLADPNKLPKATFTLTSTGKDHTIAKTRHTT